MKFHEILEEFKDYIQEKPVFYANEVKPITSSEMKDIIKFKGVRFISILSDKPIIYIFPENLMHLYVASKIGVNYREFWKNKDPIFFGEASVINGGIFYNDSYDYTILFNAVRHGKDEEKKRAAEKIHKLANGNWDLTKKYIKGMEETIQQIKKKDDFLNRK